MSQTDLTTVNPYKNGMEFLCAAGVGRPIGHYVLLKAIMKDDLSPKDEKALVVEVDTTQAICHEVISTGPQVGKVSPGEHVIHLSTAADPVDWQRFEKKQARYLLCHEDDIKLVWSLEYAREVFAKLSI